MPRFKVAEVQNYGGCLSCFCRARKLASGGRIYPESKTTKQDKLFWWGVMAFRQTRTGRYFSPFYLPANFDFEALVWKAATFDQDGENGRELPAHCDIVCPDWSLSLRLQTNDIASNKSPPFDRDSHVNAREGIKITWPAALHVQSTVTTPPQIPKSKYHGAHQRAAKKRRAKLMAEGNVLIKKKRTTLMDSSEPLRLNLDAAKFGVQLGAYCGRSTGRGGNLSHEKVSVSGGFPTATPVKLQMDGFQVVEWDARNPRPLIDSQGRCIAVLVGYLNNPDWADVCKRAYRSICDEANAAGFVSGDFAHRRGLYAAVTAGVSHGGGSVQPHTIFNLPKRGAMMNRLIGNRDIQRLAGFASSSFLHWAPSLYAYYHERLGQLFKRDPTLSRNFHNSVFPCATINFGPTVCTVMHRDSANFALGWCSIQALGNFNPKNGGHLVLHEPKLVIEFPPGALILIPSAVITHSNLPVGPHETRSSFTQFAAGELFRYVDCRFQLEKSLTCKESEEQCMKKTENMRMVLSLYSTLSELYGC